MGDPGDLDGVDVPELCRIIPLAVVQGAPFQEEMDVQDDTRDALPAQGVWGGVTSRFHAWCP